MIGARAATVDSGAVSPRAFDEGVAREPPAEVYRAPSPEVRVVHLCAFSSPYPASFVPALEAVRNAVQQRGWSFEAVFVAGAQEWDWYAALRGSGMLVRVCSLTPRRARIRRVMAILEERRGPTILHTHFANWDLSALAAARRRDPVAVIWHRHGTLSERRSAVVRDRVRFGLLAEWVDAQLCAGPSSHAQLLARGAPPERTLLFPNAIDVARFPIVTDEERATARAELELEPDADVLAAFTWHWTLKGGPLLLQSVQELASRGRRVIVVVVGSPEDARAHARRLGVDSQLRTVAPRSDPRVFFAAANVFIAPGHQEGLAYAPLESVCCGTPVVATDIPGHRHLGAYLPALRLTPQSPRPLADAIESELGAAPHDRAHRVTASRDYLNSHAGLDAWCKRLMHVYDQALRRRGYSVAPSPPVARIDRQTVSPQSRA